MVFTKDTRKDIVEWDVENWWNFIDFINHSNVDFKGKRILDIGGRNGGLSLYCALVGGAEILCTDKLPPSPKAIVLHHRYGVSDKVRYEQMNVTAIPDKYKNYFDIVVFKSVIGSVEAHGDANSGRLMSENIKKVLKPGGILFFSENLKATKIHQLLRKSNEFTWVYQDRNSIHALFSNMEMMDEKYFGFLGCFCRNAKVRHVLSTMDKLLNRIIPASWKYIGAYHYKKPVADDR
jgi:2-polyprenyl-3-methyl-5-hydroxy-6-metoxy-1,4-benzoquinol methylase